MSEQREALTQIMRLCGKSKTYTNRIQQIHDIAMRGLGMTLNQRAERHNRAAARSDDAKAVLRVEGWHRSRKLFEERQKREEAHDEAA